MAKYSYKFKQKVVSEYLKGGIEYKNYDLGEAPAKRKHDARSQSKSDLASCFLHIFYIYLSLL